MFLAVLLIAFSVIILAVMYRSARNDEAKMRELKSDLTLGAVFIVVALGMFIGCTKCGSEDDSRRRIERGYSSDPDYSPTFDSRGEYHNNGTGDRQIQYQGSREQQRDLDAIDRYAREHPDF